MERYMESNLDGLCTCVEFAINDQSHVDWLKTLSHTTPVPLITMPQAGWKMRCPVFRTDVPNFCIDIIDHDKFISVYRTFMCILHYLCHESKFTVLTQGKYIIWEGVL